MVVGTVGKGKSEAGQNSKHEARNPKHEARNSKQTRNDNIQMTETVGAELRSCFEFGICFVLRISGFVLRTLNFVLLAPRVALIDANLLARFRRASKRRGEVVAGAAASLGMLDRVDARQPIEPLPEIGVLDRGQAAVAFPVPVVFAPLREPRLKAALQRAAERH